MRSEAGLGVNELIVIAAHGPDWVDQCNESLPDGPHRVVRYSGGDYSTGVYLRTYREYGAIDRFLFIQDSMTSVAGDPLPWFRDQHTPGSVVAWQRFPMQWDTAEQEHAVWSRYPGVSPSHGIFGPVFYCERATLDLLDAQGLLPEVPSTRLEAQGAERAWAYAFAAAGVPVVGPEWEPFKLTANEPVGPFRKVFAARP